MLLTKPARPAQNNRGLETKRLAQIQKKIQVYVDQGQAAGIETLVEQNGKVIQATVVGLQNIEEKRPMQADTIFQIMSMTEPFTAIGIMMLAEDGKLSLYDNLERYLPEFHNQKLNVNGWRI